MDDGALLNPDVWVDQYRDILFRFALQLVGEKAVAEDLVQETFPAGMRAKNRFKGQSSERTWLFSILKHKIIDHYRRNSSRRSAISVEDVVETTRNFFSENGEWRIRPSNWDINPVEAYEQKEFLDAFYRCLSQLPQRLADAFVHREIDGLSTEEICKLMDITASNCWVMLCRARMIISVVLSVVGKPLDNFRNIPLFL